MICIFTRSRGKKKNCKEIAINNIKDLQDLAKRYNCYVEFTIGPNDSLPVVRILNK